LHILLWRTTLARNAMADLVPIPLAVFDRLARAVDVDSVLRRAKLPRSRFRVAKPQGTTAEFFALWRAVEQSGVDADLGLRLGVEALSDYEDVAIVAALHSATLGEGLQKLARYKRLVCPRGFGSTSTAGRLDCASSGSSPRRTRRRW